MSLALFAYRTAVHSSTEVLPFEMTFGRVSKPDSSTSELLINPSFYQVQLQAKVAALEDFVEAHMVEKANVHKHSIMLTVLSIPLG